MLSAKSVIDGGELVSCASSSSMHNASATAHAAKAYEKGPGTPRILRSSESMSAGTLRRSTAGEFTSITRLHPTSTSLVSPQPLCWSCPLCAHVHRIDRLARSHEEPVPLRSAERQI